MTDQQLFVVAIVVAIVTPLTTIVVTFMGQLFAWNSARVQRKQDLEDRKEVARQVKLAREEAARAAKDSKATLEVVHTAVVEVGEQAKAAYVEANNANIKIQGVQDALAEALNLPQKKITNTDTDTKGEAK